MFGLNFESILTYPITIDIDIMRQKLQFDGFSYYEINEQSQTIIYKINNQTCIKLSDFLYYQSIKLLKITLAQNIQICLDVIKKYNQLKEQNINHNYLSCDRVYIEMLNKSLTVMPQFIKYKIYFVGYDCPFYERTDYQYSKIDDSLAIRQIVKITLLNYKEYYKKQKKEHAIIFQNLIEDGIDQGIDSFITKSSQIFNQYQNQNNQQQVLKGIDLHFEDGNRRRNKRVICFQENILELQNQYLNNNQNCIIFQIILHHTLPLIAEEIIESTLYFNQQKPPQNQTQVQVLTQQELKQIDETYLLQLINEQKQKLENSFKFTFDLAKIKTEIKDQINVKFQILDYFQNDYNFHLNSINEITLVAKKLKEENMKLIVDEYFDIFLKMNFCQLSCLF